ncbi:MAG: aldo/keto reductase [bacterium]|nr:aldo/keto reductase [bacterium]
MKRKLVIGSANFGLNYGFKNSNGKLSQELVYELLDCAWLNSIDTIDTAMGYGDSESVIGKYLLKNADKHFKIITKINKIDKPFDRLNESLKNLNLSGVDYFLIHNFNYFEKYPELIDHLVRFKKEGKCNKIGISLYYPEELEFLLKNKVPIDAIQIAYSIFDQRFKYLFQTLKDMGIEIHVRSVFLQGLFFAKTSDLNNHFNKVKSKIDQVQQISADSGISIASLCLNFAYNNAFIDKIIIGVDNMENLKNNIKVLEDKESVKPFIESLKNLSETDVNILFPHFWKLDK